jgi:ribosome biogenesis protein ENP2
MWSGVMQEKLGLANLIGTPMLRAYMHGFFIDNKLYSKAKAIADPFAYEAYKKKRIEEKIEEERKSRISISRKLPKVNANMAARLIVESESKSKQRPETQVLEDPRFAALFEDPAFAIDEKSEEYKMLHPNADPARDKKLLAEHFEELEDGSDESASPSASVSTDGDEDTDDDEPRSSTRERVKPKMYVAKDEKSALAFKQGRSLHEEKALPLGIRSKHAQPDARRQRRGNKEISFVPRMAPDSKRKKPGRGRGRGRGRK